MQMKLLLTWQKPFLRATSIICFLGACSTILQGSSDLLYCIVPTTPSLLHAKTVG